MSLLLAAVPTEPATLPEGGDGPPWGSPRTLPPAPSLPPRRPWTSAPGQSGSWKQRAWRNGLEVEAPSLGRGGRLDRGRGCCSMASVRLKAISFSCSRATPWQPETWDLWAGAPGPLLGPGICRHSSIRESKPSVGHVTQLCCFTHLPPCLCLGRPHARRP